MLGHFTGFLLVVIVIWNFVQMEEGSSSAIKTLR